MMLAFDAVLCAILLATAAVAAVGPGLFRALVFFVVYGLLLSLGWVRLGAVDVALAEAAIGAGLTGVLLLGAAGRLRRAGAGPEGRGRFRPAPALGAAGLGLALGWAWFALPVPVAPGPQLAQALPGVGLGNPVTAVLLAFRAWDTLLESVVLLTALLGLWVLARDADWAEPLGAPQHARRGGVLDSFGRLLPPIGILVGAHLVWAGADAPGGAFQGGTVLAATGLVATLAGALARPRVAAPFWRAAVVLGPGAFALAGLAGAVLGGGFLTLPQAGARAAILAVEVSLALSIAVTLALLVLGPPARGADRDDPSSTR